MAKSTEKTVIETPPESKTNGESKPAVKRGPGRPRKNPIPAASTNGAAAPNPPGTKGDGASTPTNHEGDTPPPAAPKVARSAKTVSHGSRPAARHSKPASSTEPKPGPKDDIDWGKIGLVLLGGGVALFLALRARDTKKNGSEAGSVGDAVTEAVAEGIDTLQAKWDELKNEITSFDEKLQVRLGT